MYKILSTQNFSIALTLLLIILLSQSNIMNLFIDTILGRILLVLILLCISYTNHQLGIASTLFVIMVFACCYNYTENFGVISINSKTPIDKVTSGKVTSGKVTSGKVTSGKVTSGKVTTGKVTTGKVTTGKVTTGNVTTGNVTTGNVTTGNVTTDNIDDNVTADNIDDNVTADNIDDKYTVNEGFDILGAEQTLQRGKKSNTIMVNEEMRKYENVDPYDGWTNQSHFASIN
jgi:hypothetical protein